MNAISPTPPADDGPTMINMAVGDLLVGAVIDGRYRVERFIGEGGMGRVYECSHTTFRKRLVLKTLIPEFTSHKGAFERFLREARAAAALGSPHIVHVSDFGTLADGRSYYVMEHVDGVSLDEALESLDRPMPVHRALQIAQGVTRAIGSAHEAGVVHRDLKPDNVLLCARRGQTDFVKVLDFGLAYVATEADRITQRGELVGTPFYMAPEQCLEEPIDHRADIYAIGVLLYEMLTLELPFHSTAFVEVIRLKVAGEVRRPSSLEGCAHIPAAVEELVLACMEVSPADRVQNHHDLLRRLEALLAPPKSDISGEEPTLFANSQSTRLPASGSFAASPAAAPSTPAPAVEPSSKSGLIVAGAIGLALMCLVFLAVAGVVGWYVLRV